MSYSYKYFSLCYCNITVSYTHLDVYKRQVPRVVAWRCWWFVSRYWTFCRPPVLCFCAIGKNVNTGWLQNLWFSYEVRGWHIVRVSLNIQNIHKRWLLEKIYFHTLESVCDCQEYTPVFSLQFKKSKLYLLSFL